MDKNKQIQLTLYGTDDEFGDIRFKDFIQQLDLFKKALSETKKVISSENFATFRVVDLRHQSPSTIIVEAIPKSPVHHQKAQLLVDKVFNSLEDIDKNQYPSGFTYDTFEAYKNISKLINQNKLKDIKITSPSNGSKPVEIKTISEKIDTIVGEDQSEIGTYTGMLEAINIHSNQNVFYIYPTHLPKLKCHFSMDMQSEAISAVGKYVSVVGRKKFKPNIELSFPYIMYVSEIHVHEQLEKIPSLSRLWGIAPDITKKKSEDFIRGLRDEW